jgi:hypothetical protein
MICEYVVHFLVAPWARSSRYKGTADSASPRYGKSTSSPAHPGNVHIQLPLKMSYFYRKNDGDFSRYLASLAGQYMLYSRGSDRMSLHEPKCKRLREM